jgi:hypothetical protein
MGTPRSFTGEPFIGEGYHDYLDNPEVIERLQRFYDQVLPFYKDPDNAAAIAKELGLKKVEGRTVKRAVRDLFSQPDNFFYKLLDDNKHPLAILKDIEEAEAKLRQTYNYAGGVESHHPVSISSFFDSFDDDVPVATRLQIIKRLQQNGVTMGVSSGMIPLGAGGHMAKTPPKGERWLLDPNHGPGKGLSDEEIFRNNVSAHSNPADPHAKLPSKLGEDGKRVNLPFEWRLDQKVSSLESLDDAYDRIFDQVVGPQMLMNKAGWYNPREVASRTATVKATQDRLAVVNPVLSKQLASVDPSTINNPSIIQSFNAASNVDGLASGNRGISQNTAQNSVIRSQYQQNGRLRFGTPSEVLPLKPDTKSFGVVPTTTPPIVPTTKPSPTATVTPKPDPIAYIPDTAARKAGHQSIAQRVAQPTVKPAIPEGNITKLKPKGPRGVKAPKGVGRAARSLAIMAPLAGASLLASGAEAKERSDEANRNPTALNKGKSAVANFGLAADGLALTPLAPIAEPASMGAAVVNMGLDALPSVVKNAPKVTKAVTSTMNTVHQAPAKAATQVLKEGKKWLKQLGINL